LTEVSSNSALGSLGDPVKEEKMTQENASIQVDTNGKSRLCLNHFGYLSERKTKEQIPDECLTCKDILQCMLKKTKQ
jgi:hypothetical protein